VRPEPPEGAVAVASHSHRDAATDDWLAAHGITQTISIGSSLKFCLLAAGEADVYPRFGPTMEWDTAAGDAVLRVAGGNVQTPAGDDFTYGKPDYRNGDFVAFGGFSPITASA
jgi:3'(2'), 5'-bisphosphate nucleotidase